MFNPTQPSQAVASAQSSMAPPQSGRAGEMDDYALGCECADPALQIASWGQEAGEAGQAAVAA
jgi:hypothetical protein